MATFAPFLELAKLIFQGSTMAQEYLSGLMLHVSDVILKSLHQETDQKRKAYMKTTGKATCFRTLSVL
jgi:hypothetical protein